MEINKIYNGDCLTILKTLSSESVNCVVTSPPYWALRDYGVEGQLGLESTFQEYINKLCDIFDEIKRVLKKDGTCWVNIGDTYGGSGKGAGVSDKSTLRDKPIGEHEKKRKLAKESWTFLKKPKIKDEIAKSLCQIPSRFAIEMINRGWILRNEIIWHKPNCMPSSVKDRFTVDFEKIFFFVKNKKYWFETQYEPLSYKDKRGNNRIAYNGKLNKKRNNFNIQPVDYFGQNQLGKNKRCIWTIATQSFKEAHFATFPEKLIEPTIKAGCCENGIVLDCFMGAGTTALVALKQNKNYIGIELNNEYIKIAENRINNYLKNENQSLKLAV